jgi:hypothetical protein
VGCSSSCRCAGRRPHSHERGAIDSAERLGGALELCAALLDPSRLGVQDPKAHPEADGPRRAPLERLQVLLAFRDRLVDRRSSRA